MFFLKDKRLGGNEEVLVGWIWKELRVVEEEYDQNTLYAWMKFYMH